MRTVWIRAAELHTATSARRVLELEVRIKRQLAERCGDLIAVLESAAGIEPEMAKVFEAGMARHRAARRRRFERLAKLGKLRTTLSSADATAIVASLCAPAVYSMFTAQHGWTFDDCEAWLNDTLRRQLL